MSESHVLRECVCHRPSGDGTNSAPACETTLLQTSDNLMGREAQQGRGSMTAAKAERGFF